ncbi:cytochrome c oxidase accessory protein CcoG [Flavobacterium sp. GCM10027622]|uniref:cytochrome c oxidase accessory protein CcoG n=1 Tax=unclassified Flavobacterium TaxID=196869 RepID=UPI003620D4CA
MQSPNDDFRDSIATIDKEGKRAWIYAKIPKGKLYERRKWLSYFLLAFLFTSPFLTINGNQFLLFNILERKFSIFGNPFWPQDFHLVVISMVIGVVGLALFTVAFGRIFCGWFCPQTIFMEMVFRRIEFWIEGDRGAQIKLDKQEWNTEKIRKKSLKYLLFFLLSFLIANVFLAYIVGSDHVLDMVRQGPFHNTGTLIALIIFTAVFFFVYAWFREQVCIIACPYGRMQGVLLDTKSINVAYDHVRGEGEKGRGKFKKGEDRLASGKGDCIDCHQCVNVCPTGIDIRNGVQLECINCTACIDECNSIMKSVDLPINLIRYASEDEIVKKETFVFTNRMKGYAAVLLILTGIFFGMLFLRNDVEATVLRLPGQLYEYKGDTISNVFTYKIVNKTMNDFDHIHFKIVDPKGVIKLVGNQQIKVKKDNLTQGTLFIEINPAVLQGDKTEVTIEVYNGNRLLEVTTTNFLGPRHFN